MYRKCSVVSTKISEIIDRDVGIIMRLRFYSHLMMCPKCRDYFNQFKLLKRASGTPTPDELPDDFDRVLGFVMEEIEESTKASHLP
tara:strand:+ start:63748 stop:64005 length:258 start_codon:yes stop_codon:yes gene_type:complete